MKSTRPSFREFRAWRWMAAAWLLTCAVAPAQIPNAETPAATVAAATPAEITPTPGSSPVERGRVLYPANGVPASPGLAHGRDETAAMPGLATSFLMLLALCAAGYYLLRRQTGFVPVGKGQRKLVVSESRSLGNRQFLVVVEYENERVLLGVTPGKIDYLCPLPTGSVPTGVTFKEGLS